jgi:N-acetylglucosaminyl-diphospho-decaprenol L-rhamnosyltransferase
VTGELAAIVVVYHSGPVQPLIDELGSQGVTHVVVVDNGASSPYARESYVGGCRVSEVAFGANLGYGVAINRALILIQEPIVLISNPDVMPHPGAIASLASIVLANADIGVVGPKILDTSGKRYPSFRRFPSLWQSMWHGAIGWLMPGSPATRSYRMSDLDPGEPVVVPWLSGACLMCPRSALVAIGGFDAKYRLYMEDVDLCRRLLLHGYQVVYQPAAVVTHVGGVSSGKQRFRSIAQHHRSMVAFAAPEQRSTLALLVVTLGIGLRCGLSLVRAGVSGSVRN